MVAEPGARPAGSYRSAGPRQALQRGVGREQMGGTEQIPLMSHWERERERFTDCTNLTDELHFQSDGFENQDESWMLRSCCRRAAAWLYLRVLLTSLHVRSCSPHSADLSCFHAVVLESMCWCMLSAALDIGDVRRILEMQKSGVQIPPCRLKYLTEKWQKSRFILIFSSNLLLIFT